MKKYRIITKLSLVASLFIACSKDKVNTPEDFNVTTVKLTYRIGDTILYNLQGRADIVTFYSGEMGKDYNNKNRTLVAGSEKLVFQSSMQQGLLTNNDSLRLLISSNLKGYDAASIGKATWTDISSRNTKWPTTLATSFTTSDSINVSDFNSESKVNFAFRYLGKKNPISAQRKWQIQNVTLSNNLPDGSKTAIFSVFADVGWVQASIKNNLLPGTLSNGYVGYNAWNVGTANVSTSDSIRNSNGIPIKNAYPIAFDPGPSVNNDDNEDWLITTAVNLKTVKPDIGIVIKNGVAINLTSYRYILKTAGTFIVTFTAQNGGEPTQYNVVRQLRIVVTP